MSTLTSERAKQITLSGETIRLELLSDKHLSEKYVSWLNDPVVCQYNSHGTGAYTFEKASQYIQRIQQSDNTLVFAIVWKQTGEHIGNISLNDIIWKHRSGEISILIGERTYWGKGVGTQALKLVKDYAFDVLKLHRVWVGMTEENAGMIEIARKAGFQEEGLLRDAFFKDGVYHNITQWSLINPKDKNGRLD